MLQIVKIFNELVLFKQDNPQFKYIEVYMASDYFGQLSAECHAQLGLVDSAVVEFRNYQTVYGCKVYRTLPFYNTRQGQMEDAPDYFFRGVK